MTETLDVTTRPWGLKWRSSVFYVTFVVGLGISTDLLVYSVIIPVLPFQLEHLGYHGASSLTGWLLFAYSAGLVVSTPPIAVLSEHYNDRKWPLLFGQLCLVASQIMIMEVRKYWLMIIARIFQGISSSVIWVVGLALLCDTVPEAAVGKYLGIAMSGLSIGFLTGPPAGGALYAKFGFRGPFIFSIIITMLDFFGRLLIIERKDALLWGVDPAATVQVKPTDEEKNMASSSQVTLTKTNTSTDSASSNEPPKRLSNLQVVAKLFQSPRAIAATTITLFYGISYTSTEPTLSLHLQDVWGLKASQVGLVYIAVVLPSLISSPLAGWLCDLIGAEWVTASCLLLAVPWWAALMVEKSLAFFITVIAFLSFFTLAILSPLSAEFAAVSREYGIGYAHVYGAFNICYGLGAGLGPVIGGLLYDHIKRGWEAISLMVVVLFTLSTILSFCFIGDRPFLSRLLHRHRKD